MYYAPLHPITAAYKHRNFGMAILLASLAILSARPANAQCPAIGADTTCGVVLVITNFGAIPVPTGQQPYDTIDDTLVGVLNLSSIPVHTLVLASPLDIFGFDGDGICGISPITGMPYNPGPPACPYGPTGYEGPGVSFSNFSLLPEIGTVTFNPSIPTNGGTAYFSLENALGVAAGCTTLLNNSITPPTSGGVTAIGSFSPQIQGLVTLSEAASICGFADFNWQQTITAWPSPSNLFQAGNPTALTAPPAFLDPPLGGYTYGFAGRYPFYYPEGSQSTTCAEFNKPGGTCILPVIDPSDTVLSFFDSPKDPCFAGGGGAGTAACNGKTVPAGSSMEFTTHLIGILPGFVANTNCIALQTCIDLGIGFSWKDNFNGGKNGGVFGVTASDVPVDPTGGTGRITVTSVQQTTTYADFVIKSVNGKPVGAPVKGMCKINTSSNLFTQGQAITLTASVVPPAASGTPTGTITFVDSADSFLILGTVPVNGGGQASITVVLPSSPDEQWVGALYSGDSSFQSCQSEFLAEELK
jgi:Bacterial Ig-like domain (group 3)